MRGYTPARIRRIQGCIKGSSRKLRRTELEPWKRPNLGKEVELWQMWDQRQVRYVLSASWNEAKTNKRHWLIRTPQETSWSRYCLPKPPRTGIKRAWIQLKLIARRTRRAWGQSPGSRRATIMGRAMIIASSRHPPDLSVKPWVGFLPCRILSRVRFRLGRFGCFPRSSVLARWTN